MNGSTSTWRTRTAFSSTITGDRPPAGLALHPRDGFRTPLHEELVGARHDDRVRAHVHEHLCRLPERTGVGPARVSDVPRCAPDTARAGCGAGVRTVGRVDECGGIMIVARASRRRTAAIERA